MAYAYLQGTMIKTTRLLCQSQKFVIDASVTETAVPEDYFALRQLKKGALGVGCFSSSLGVSLRDFR